MIGTYSCWGHENRESLVRLTGSPGQHHFEVRCIDGTASPYLALTAILGVGMEGVYEGRELTVQEPPNGEVASDLSEEARQKLGITKRMPRTLQQARDMTMKEKTVEKVMGQDFLQKYMSVNKVSVVILCSLVYCLMFSLTCNSVVDGCEPEFGRPRRDDEEAHPYLLMQQDGFRLFQKMLLLLNVARGDVSIA